MTTTTEHLATLGLTMDDARSIVSSLLPDQSGPLIAACQHFGITGAMLGEVIGFAPDDFSDASLALGYGLAMDFVLAGRAQELVELCDYIGISAAQLGATVGLSAAELRTVLDAYFDVDSSGLPGSAPDPTVSAVSNPAGSEGGTLVFEVALTGPTLVETRYDFAAGGDLGDVADFSIGNGVGLDLSGPWQVVVPAGVSSFTFTLHMAQDADTANDQVALTFGGMAGMGTVHDDDPPAPASDTPLMPEEMADMLGLLHLNGESDMLSTASLRADIIAQSNEADYWALFDAAGYAGGEDGFFTNAEIGWSLGTLPADAETMESLFYGTLIHALKAVDFEEMMEIGYFVQTHEQQLDSGDEAAFAQLVDLVVEAFEDPATASFLSDAEIHTAIVETGVDLVGMVLYEPSIFHGLVNWAG